MSRPSCAQCLRPQSVCYCHLIQKVANRWPVRILQHTLETKHPLNTARIAQLALSNCQILPSPDTLDEAALRASFTDDGLQPVLIYPSQTSQPLDALTLEVDCALLFIDANWRKSRRLYLQSPWLQSLPAYHLDPAASSRYRIRKEPRAGYLSTLEAIVTVLSAADPAGAPEAARMLQVMDWMIEQQLQAGAGRL